MGSSVVPAQQPAGSENWQVISSVTPSGSSVSFTSISGYRKLKVVYNVTTSGNAFSYFNFNSDSGNKYSYSNYILNQTGPTAQIRTTAISMSGLTTSQGGCLEVSNVLTTGIKTFTAYSTGGSGGASSHYPLGDYETTSAITSLSFTLTANTFTAGNVTLFGVAQ